MRLKNIVPVVLLLLLSVSLRADNTFKFRGYSGGMMVHGGYVQSAPFDVTSLSGAVQEITMRGFVYGLGGTAKFNFGTLHHQLRVGMEGYGTKAAYAPDPSYVRIGWGGLTLDYIHQSKGKVHPFAGCTIGGGGLKNQIVLDGNVSDMQAEPCGIMRFYGFMTVTPYIGMEISLTQKVRVIIKADYMIDVTGSHPDFPHGPRLYLGILFGRPTFKK